jgi:hypothetical protein
MTIPGWHRSWFSVYELQLSTRARTVQCPQGDRRPKLFLVFTRKRLLHVSLVAGGVLGVLQSPAFLCEFAASSGYILSFRLMLLVWDDPLHPWGR